METETQRIEHGVVFPVDNYQDATYYDAVYGASTGYDGYWINLQWAPLWFEIARRVPVGAYVFDLGCGPANILDVLRHQDIGRYTGLDFSSVAMDLAQERADLCAFRCSLIQSDITRVGLSRDLLGIGHDDVLVILSEVLEHLEDDLEMLKHVPVGTRLIISVPTRYAVGHVRYFPALFSAVLRYGPLMDFTEAFTIYNRWHLLVGTRATP